PSSPLVMAPSERLAVVYPVAAPPSRPCRLLRSVPSPGRRSPLLTVVLHRLGIASPSLPPLAAPLRLDRIPLPLPWGRAAVELNQDLCALRRSELGGSRRVLHSAAGRIKSLALEGLVPRLEQALDESEAERRQFVDEILQKIATRVGELYEAIHPTEGL